MLCPGTTVLLADSDARERARLRENLEADGISVQETDDEAGLLACLERKTLDLIVLDLQLSSIGGLHVCHLIKDRADVPIVVLTALNDESMIVRALDRYVEDYILKSTSLAEILARIRRVARRRERDVVGPSIVTCPDGHLRLDLVYREAQTSRGVCRLSPLECRLLEILVRNTGRLVPTMVLRERVWEDGIGSPNSLWEHVRRIRRKLGDDAARPRYIVNRPGLGYGFLVKSDIAEGAKASEHTAEHQTVGPGAVPAGVAEPDWGRLTVNGQAHCSRYAGCPNAATSVRSHEPLLAHR